jgi:hypothetical protein
MDPNNRFPLRTSDRAFRHRATMKNKIDRLFNQTVFLGPGVPMDHKPLARRMFTKPRPIDRFLIRDANRDNYPKPPIIEGTRFTWAVFLYMWRDERYLSVQSARRSVFVTQNGEWKVAREGEEVPVGYSRIRAQEVGDIAYDDILVCNSEGDDSYPDPHLFCRCIYFGEPFMKKECWATREDGTLYPLDPALRV